MIGRLPQCNGIVKGQHTEEKITLFLKGTQGSFMKLCKKLGLKKEFEDIFVVFRIREYIPGARDNMEKKL